VEINLSVMSEPENPRDPHSGRTVAHSMATAGNLTFFLLLNRIICEFEKQRRRKGYVLKSHDSIQQLVASLGLREYEEDDGEEEKEDEAECKEGAGEAEGGLQVEGGHVSGFFYLRVIRNWP
jgi:hypothetical protein